MIEKIKEFQAMQEHLKEEYSIINVSGNQVHLYEVGEFMEIVASFNGVEYLSIERKTGEHTTYTEASYYETNSGLRFFLILDDEEFNEYVKKRNSLRKKNNPDL